MARLGKEPSDITEWLNILAPEIVAAVPPRLHQRRLGSDRDEYVQRQPLSTGEVRPRRQGARGELRRREHRARDGGPRRVGCRHSWAPAASCWSWARSRAEELRDAFAEQAKALAEGGVDFFLTETMADLDEVVAAVEGARSVSKLPVAVTMSFDTGKPEAGLRTMMGVTVAQLVAKARGAGRDGGRRELRAGPERLPDALPAVHRREAERCRSSRR